ncbi:hypothetical protein [Estrella lausannensis]|uniref:Uncharacterized protein n=1 Tax=Estrella lausannensis TaxID=483423 RepID=A0A0H5DS18_9BACT|nr:hypothetical protein [Estrella lausannensis]CRX39452.1 hypothetical protein ELAC_2131 [Estrella lausannensis]
MRYIFFPCLSVMFAAYVEPLAAHDGADCKRCERGEESDSGCCERDRPAGYDPYKRYYPYNSIYQDSKVRDVSSDDDESYWPSKRDDDFMDALMR